MSTLDYAPPLFDLLTGRGNDIPAWLPLGWISVESGGKIGENDTTVSSLGGEQSLFQLSADERRRTGFMDETRLLSDPDYALRAGLTLIDTYGGDVASAGVTADNDPVYWYLIKFAHGIGSGAMKIIVRGFVSDNGRQPESIDEFKAYALDHPYGSQAHTQKWLGNADRVRLQGLALQAAAGVASIVPGGGGTASFVGILAVLGLGGYLLLGKS